MNALQELAYHLGIDPSEVVSMLNLDGGYNGGGQTATENDKLAEAYKVLGVDPSATNDEVKAAYRKMALKHHPDRVAALGEDVRKSAERKFQEINDAKERVLCFAWHELILMIIEHKLIIKYKLIVKHKLDH